MMREDCVWYDLMQTLEHWQEWKEKCALALCEDVTKRALPVFVHARFARFVDAYARTTNAGTSMSATPEKGEAWHRFETHFRLHAQTGGKSYKDWLFAKVEGKEYSPRESVEAGVTLLVRDVVREYLRREYSAKCMVSTSEKMGSTCGAGLTLEELLPGSADTLLAVEDGELDRMAQVDAEDAFVQMDRRERVALLVHEAGLSLACPEAIKAAACSKSSLNNAFHGALARIAELTREKHPREDKSVQASLACRTFDRVRHLIFFWGRLEKACAQLCNVIEAKNSEK